MNRRLPALDMERLCREYNIDNRTGGDKHCRPGWVQLSCPFCRGDGFHLGYNLSGGYFNCWRCGGHTTLKVLQAILPLNVSFSSILESFRGLSGPVTGISSRAERLKTPICRLPRHSDNLSALHKSYLKRRGFDPEVLTNKWGIMGTNHLGTEKFRVVIPIKIMGELVSYVCRDVTGKSKIPYLACPDEGSTINIKDSLYGYDQARHYNWCVAVEGVFDVWKLGSPAVATFGTAYRSMQVRLLADWPIRFIMMDGDAPGREARDRLAAALSVFPGRTILVDFPYRHKKDAGDLTLEESRELMNGLRELR